MISRCVWAFTASNKNCYEQQTAGETPPCLKVFDVDLGLRHRILCLPQFEAQPTYLTLVSFANTLVVPMSLTANTHGRVRKDPDVAQT